MDLQDYSGDYKPDLKLEDLSKEALIKLVKINSKDFIELGGIWHTYVGKKYGYDVANDFTWQMWVGKDPVVMDHDLKRILPAFKIEGDDIASIFKYLQLTPAVGCYNYEHEVEFKNNNHAIMTITHCPSLLRFEKYNVPKAAKFGCELDIVYLQNVANRFNPKIKVKCLTPLPRKSPGDVPCAWEFKLVE